MGDPFDANTWKINEDNFYEVYGEIYELVESSVTYSTCSNCAFFFCDYDNCPEEQWTRAGGHPYDICGEDGFFLKANRFEEDDSYRLRRQGSSGGDEVW